MTPFWAPEPAARNMPFLFRLENVFSFVFIHIGCISIRDGVSIRRSFALHRRCVKAAGAWSTGAIVAGQTTPSRIWPFIFTN